MDVPHSETDAAYGGKISLESPLFEQGKNSEHFYGSDYRVGIGNIQYKRDPCSRGCVRMPEKTCQALSEFHSIEQYSFGQTHDRFVYSFMSIT